MNELGSILGGLLAIVDDLPLIEVRRAVGFVALVHFLRIGASHWRLRSVDGWAHGGLHLDISMVLRHVNIAIVLLVVQKNVIIEHHSLTVLPVLVPLLDEEGNSLSTRFLNKLK